MYQFRDMSYICRGQQDNPLKTCCYILYIYKHTVTIECKKYTVDCFYCGIRKSLKLGNIIHEEAVNLILKESCRLRSEKDA